LDAFGIGTTSDCFHSVGIWPDWIDRLNTLVGCFESRSTAASNKKWIISANDLDRMYAMFENNREITFWCDKKVESITKRTSPDVNEDGPVTKRAKWQAANDDVRKELAEKHAKKFSKPQYKLWTLMITNGQWTDKANPPNIPLFGCEKVNLQKKKLKIL